MRVIFYDPLLPGGTANMTAGDVGIRGSLRGALRRQRGEIVGADVAGDVDAVEARGFETLQLAVMGCIVNGPGESKLANIGISLPGTGETPSAPVYVDGEKTVTLRG